MSLSVGASQAFIFLTHSRHTVENTDKDLQWTANWTAVLWDPMAGLAIIPISPRLRITEGFTQFHCMYGCLYGFQWAHEKHLNNISVS